MVWNGSPSVSETRKCRHRVIQFCTGTGIDLGPGPEKIFPGAIGIGIDGAVEMRMDCFAELFGEPFQADYFDFVYSSHLLEHAQDVQVVLSRWWRLVKPGGHLILYLPHKDLYREVGPGAGHLLTPESILQMMSAFASFVVVVNEVHDENDEYSFELVLKKAGGLPGGLMGISPKPPKRVVITRYGGYGDHMIVSTILPALKRAGYHVTYFGSDKALEILKHNPHIDRFWAHPNEGPANRDLVEMWGRLSREFDAHLLMSMTIEKKMIFKEGFDQEFFLPPEQRRAICKGDYVDAVIESANECLAVSGLPPLDVTDEEKCPVFYPTPHEKWITSLARESHKGKFLIGWVIGGSATHKVWPWAAKCAQQVLEQCPEARVYTFGGQEYRMFEWQGNRVRNKAGLLSIRESAAMLQTMDLVVTPETGLAHCVAAEPMRKILLLSHSSAENIGRYWRNTVQIVPEAPCHPCHQIHDSLEHCPLSERTPNKMRFPVCVAELPPEKVAQEIIATYNSLRYFQHHEKGNGVLGQGEEIRLPGALQAGPVPA